MIPCRGLRWSSQTIGIGRRRLETFSSRQFSSIQNAPIRSTPLRPASSSGIYAKVQLSRPSTIARYGAGIRFASTAPIAQAAPVPAASLEPVASVAATPDPSSIVTSLGDASDFTMESSLLDIPERIGFLKELGLDYGWGPTATMEFILEHIHVYAGTPWWISIILTALFVRVALFKGFMGASDTSARMASIKPFMEAPRLRMMEAQKAKDTNAMMQARQELSLISRRAGVKFYKLGMPLVQIFTGYGTWKLLRGMSELPLPGLENGGALWFYNLTIPDPIFLFPIATSGIMHWVVRQGGETGATNAATMNPGMYKFMLYGMPLMSFLFTFWLPASAQLSFLVASALSYLQLMIFRSPTFRERFNMFPLPTNTGVNAKTAPPAPYKGIMNKRAPLTQAELDGTYSVPTGGETKKNPLAAYVGNAVKDFKGTISSTTDQAREYVGQTKEGDEKRARKADLKAAQQYEERRMKEIKQQAEERRAQAEEGRKRSKRARKA